MAQINMVAANLLKWVAWGGVKVFEIHGWNNNASSVYIQLHQTPPKSDGTLAAGTVPAVKSIVATANNGFMYNFGTDGIYLNELLVALSSTEVNYTAVGAGAGLDMTLFVDSVYLCNGNETVVGDITTNQQTLQVWTEATGLTIRPRLLRVDVINSDTTHTPAELQVYATDAITGLVVSQAPVTVPSGGTATTVANYGVDGVSPFQQDANYTQHFGCSLKVTASTNCTIRAIYR